MTLIGQEIPFDNETPSRFADRLAVLYAKQASEYHKKSLGQFFTSYDIATFLADFAKVDKKKIRVLDPGCGIGILSTAICEKLATTTGPCRVNRIELVAFETDIEILPYSENCLTFLGNWLKKRGIEFTYFLCKNDFILHNSHILNGRQEIDDDYDLVICNPPYFKLPKGDERIETAKSVIYGQTNIYSIFMVLAARLLKPQGQLIFITPRSFCSGHYFSMFRTVFFNIVDFEAIHLFNSRNVAFKRDKVLQENIIIVARQKRKKASDQQQLLENDSDESVILSFSNGISDISSRTVKSYPTSRILNIHSRQKVLHLPTSEVDEQVLDQIRQWDGSLHNLGLEISTGPVVDFRSNEYIKFEHEGNVAPLIWLHNVQKMNVKWPYSITKGKPKGQYITICRETKSRLVLNKNYVLLRRFSSKDDKTRLIATPYFKKDFVQFQYLGVENHLNYIYHKNRELSEIETIGLAGLLNSRLFDLYFRIFNGNINVSATELRDFPLPDFDLIRCLGRKIASNEKNNKVTNLDSLIKKIFNINFEFAIA